MPTEFDKIKNFAGWKAKLKELLAAAEKASSRNDDDGRLSVATRLNNFVLESVPNTDAIRALDELATAAAHELSVAVVEGAIERISHRTAALHSITKRLEAVSLQAEQAAASIRLAKAHRVIDAFTEAVRAVDDLDAVLADGTDEQLRKRLATLARSMRVLRTELDDSIGRV
ncbi:MAG TPA: hypothetical protein VLF19_04075 [Methylomirabilota bacterium]|nr:hypothetical protein [Methylomirabilota bacterium]